MPSPLTLPLIKTLKTVEFRQPVTFFVGENGSGKSTLLEAIAAGIGTIAAGEADSSSLPLIPQF